MADRGISYSINRTSKAWIDMFDYRAEFRDDPTINAVALTEVLLNCVCFAALSLVFNKRMREWMAKK